MYRVIVLTGVVIQLLLFSSFAYAAPTQMPNIDQHKILTNAPKLNAKALQYAINGYKWAYRHGNVKNPYVLTVIDFSLPSDKKRVWVIDLKTSKVILNVLTTQGRGSGLFKATRFSNRNNTDETSLGVYETLNSYHGEHGLSERLRGLERGINDHAYIRDIVVHPAWYATPSFVKKYHRTGRSWGCFAVNPAISRKLVKLTCNGSIIFAYAKPEQHDPYLVSI